jgi:hypothetical protein
MVNPLRTLYDKLRFRQRDYQLAFTSPPGQAVLHDLAHFCRANETTFHEDPRLHAVAEGRREVWLRIQKHLRLTPDQLFAVYSGRTFNPHDLDKEDEK